MLKPRNLLEKELSALFGNLEDTKQKQEYYQILEQEYNLPIDISSDIITMRKYLSEYNEFILYLITTVVTPDKIKTYYTPREIEAYSGQKYHRVKISTQLDLPMFAVTEDQWIGVSDVQFLMRLREAQAINYNADTQRALKAVIRGENVVYEPSVNYHAVEEIAESYAQNTFIPNTISLNINIDDETTELTFEDNVLHIKNFKYFDIFDGYHRYLGMARNFDKNHDFNYPIELRITNFSVTKAQHFIWQEDHKTKMKKVDVAALDKYNSGNMVADRLNKDPECNLYNLINLKNGLVHAGLLSIAINRCYFNTRTKIERKDIIKVSKIIKTQLNTFTDEYDQYLDKKWNRYETWLIIFGIYNNYSPVQIKAAIDKISNEQKKLLENADDLKNKQLRLMEEIYDGE